jgi:hypothetical protein
MRTTVTIDDDLAVRLERERLEQHKTFKEYLNEVLRAGLAARAGAGAAPAERFHTEPAHLGQRLVGDVHSISELLAIAEGDDHR